MRRDAILEESWIFQVSLYARFLSMQALHKVQNMPEYDWVIPDGRVLHVWSSFRMYLNMHPVLNMPSFRIRQGCEYAKVTQGAEYALIDLNMP